MSVAVRTRLKPGCEGLVEALHARPIEERTRVKENDQGSADPHNHGKIHISPGLPDGPAMRHAIHKVRNPGNESRHHGAGEMDNVGFLGQDHAGEPHPQAPEIIRSAAPPQSEQPEDEKHREELEPDFVNRIAPVEDEPRRDSHRKCRHPAHVPPDERLKFHREINAKNAHEHHRNAQGQDISPKQCLTKEENVKMKRAVIIRWVVSVKSVFDHLIDEPAVDSFVKMGRLHLEEEDAQNGAERDNRPQRPINFGGALFQIGPAFTPRGKNC